MTLAAVTLSLRDLRNFEINLNATLSRNTHHTEARRYCTLIELLVFELHWISGLTYFSQLLLSFALSLFLSHCRSSVDLYAFLMGSLLGASSSIGSLDRALSRRCNEVESISVRRCGQLEASIVVDDNESPLGNSRIGITDFRWINIIEGKKNERKKLDSTLLIYRPLCRLD